LNIVVVEGGPKALARYKALMMRRIKWSNEDDSEHLIHANHCHLVWEGVLRQPEYRGFRQIACPTEQNLKETLGDSGQQYFDAARNFIPPIQ
jgi:U4/U6 small nuclear ribonucleoprotein PRP3